MKKSKDMTTEELIGLTDDIKRGMSKKFLEDIETFKKVGKMTAKKTISKKEAIMIAYRIKSGMTIKVMSDLENLKNNRSKVLMAEQS